METKTEKIISKEKMKKKLGPKRKTKGERKTNKKKHEQKNCEGKNIYGQKKLWAS